MDTIGLYKIDYEIEGERGMDTPIWSAGVLAYSQEEAIKTLADFLKKGFKINTLSFQGPCHAVSDSIRKKLFTQEKAKLETPKPTKKAKKVKAEPKKSIIKKEDKIDTEKEE